MSGSEMMYGFQAIRKYGFWAGMRHLKNIGYSLDDTYFIVFGKYPTR